MFAITTLNFPMKHDFLQLVKHRQSDRKYENRKIEKEKIEMILEAARLAPSACNAQPWRFIVVDQPEIIAAVAKAAEKWAIGANKFAKEAPLIIVVVEEKANLSSRFGAFIKNKYFPLIDIGIVTEHICLAAADLGLGSCIMGWFDEPTVKKLLQIPRSRRVPLLITIGYPANPNREKNRKPMEEIVSWNKY